MRSGFSCPNRAIRAVSEWRLRSQEFPPHFQWKRNGKKYFANCVWDACGVGAALHCDAVSHALDGQTGEPLTLEVKNGQPILKPYLAHFAVPAAHWWDNLIFT